jgi:hypothetical protein
MATRPLTIIGILITCFVALGGCTGDGEAGPDAGPDPSGAHCSGPGGIVTGMATRPSALPLWATTGEKLKPPSGKQDVGYSPGEEPGAQWDNYRADLVRQWNQYHRDVLDETAVALGGADATDLPVLCEQGDFTPVLVGSPTPDFTYGTQIGKFTRIGNTVWVHITIGWTNTDPAFDVILASILPPFVPLTDGAYVDMGMVSPSNSSLGTQAANFTTIEALIAPPAAAPFDKGFIRIAGRETTMIGPQSALNFGNDAIEVSMSLTYRTTGEYNY